MIDGRNFYDQPINDLIKEYDEARKRSTGQGDDYTIGCFLDCAYFRDNYKLIAVDLSKPKSFRFWYKSNSTNSISRSCWRRWWYKHKTLHYSRRIKRNRILQRNSKSFVTTYEEINDIIKIVQVLQDSNILLKEVTKTIKSEIKSKKVDF